MELEDIGECIHPRRAPIGIVRCNRPSWGYKWLGPEASDRHRLRRVFPPFPVVLPIGEVARHDPELWLHARHLEREIGLDDMGNDDFGFQRGALEFPEGLNLLAAILQAEHLDALNDGLNE